MDRLLAGPPATARRATFRKGQRTARRAGCAFPEAGPPLSSGHADPVPVPHGIGRAPVQPAFMAAWVWAIQDIIKEDFLDKTTTAPAEFVRAADAAMPLAMRAAKKTAAKAKKPAARKAAAKKPAARKAAVRKPAAKKAAARKPAARKAAAKKPAARKAAARKPAAKKAAARKPAARKAAAKKPAAKRAVRRPRKAAAPATPPASAEAAS